jgi:hypothetical protein
MKIDRRNLIRVTSAAGSVSALRTFMFPFSSVPSHATSPLGPFVHRLPAGGADANGLIFSIDGWERHSMAESGGPAIASGDTGSNASPNQQVWIGVNQAWRANWR